MHKNTIQHFQGGGGGKCPLPCPCLRAFMRRSVCGPQCNLPVISLHTAAIGLAVGGALQMLLLLLLLLLLMGPSAVMDKSIIMLHLRALNR